MVWKNLGTLYHYELKKLVGRKLLWIALAVCILARANRENLSGRAIDDDLLKEMVEAYRLVPSDVARYTLTDEYQTYARPYSDVYDIVHAWTGMNFSSIVNWDASEDSLYALRSVDLEKDWKELHLTETEKAFWTDQESSIKRPVFYDYHEAYSIMFDSYLSVGVTMLLLIAVVLSSVFSEEHTRRTDLYCFCGNSTGTAFLFRSAHFGAGIYYYVCDAYDNCFALGDIRYGSVRTSAKQCCCSCSVDRADLSGDDGWQHL